MRTLTQCWCNDYRVDGYDVATGATLPDTPETLGYIVTIRNSNSREPCPRHRYRPIVWALNGKTIRVLASSWCRTGGVRYITMTRLSACSRACWSDYIYKCLQLFPLDRQSMPAISVRVKMREQTTSCCSHVVHSLRCETVPCLYFYVKSRVRGRPVHLLRKLGSFSSAWWQV